MAAGLLGLLVHVLSDIPAALSGPCAVLWLWAALCGMFTALRYRAARRAEEERQDFETARSSHSTSALFNAELTSEPFSAARSRQWMDLRFIPALGPASGSLLLTAAFLLLRPLARGWVPNALPQSSWLATAGLLAGIAFTAAIVARYAAVLARSSDRAALRDPASALALAAVASFLSAAALILGSRAEVPAALRYAPWILSAGVGIAGVERMILFVLRLYRPRPKETADGAMPVPPPRPALDSRIGALMADPRAFAASTAESLDYQFGFKVSETWFYRFTRRALLPLALFQALVLYGLSCVVALDADEQAVLERNGRPVPESEGGTLGPGLHWKAPWPFETVRRFPVQRIQTLTVGFTQRLNDPMPTEVLWSRPHFEQEDRWVTATREAPGAAENTAPVGMISVNIPIQYRVTNLRNWLYLHATPEAALRAIAQRAVTRETAARDANDILGQGQPAFQQALKQRIETDAAAAGLGIELVLAGLNGVHPPVPVVSAYEDVVGSMEEREARLLEGRAVAARRVPEAEAEAARRVAAAAGESARRSATGRAEADSFALRREAQLKSPQVYRGRAYLHSLEQALRGTRLYVIATRPEHEVVQFNFEDRLPSNLFDFSGPAGSSNPAPETGGESASSRGAAP